MRPSTDLFKGLFHQSFLISAGSSGIRLAWLAVTLLACARSLPGQGRVMARFATPEISGANVDSCAVWVAPEGGESLLFVTEKEGDRIQVWRATDGSPYAPRPFLGGERNSSEPGQFDRPNGVWVLYHVPFDGGFADILLVTEQFNRRVQIFRLPELEYFGQFGTGEIGKGYGLASYQDGSDYFVFITDNIPPGAAPGKIKKYRLRPGAGGLGADLVLAVGSSSGNPPLPHVESILADAATGWLHVCGDEGGDEIWLFDLDGAYLGRTYGSARFEFDQEGINLYDSGHGEGYLVVSDQYLSGPNEFEVFDRRSLESLGNFESNRDGPVTSNTDGAFLEQRPFPGFPNGAFYAINDDENVHAYDWTDIAAALGLEIAPLDRPFPADRSPSGGERGNLWFHGGSWWGVLPREEEWILARLEDGTFTARLGLGRASAAAVWSNGDRLAVALSREGAETAVRRFDHDDSMRSYLALGGAIPVAGASGPLTSLAAETENGGAPGASWLAWVANGEARVSWSDADFTEWEPGGLVLGIGRDIRPRLLRTGAATGLLFADDVGIALRWHTDGDPPPTWSEPLERAFSWQGEAFTAAPTPDGRVVVCASGAGGDARIAVRSPGGDWSVSPVPWELNQPGLVVDAASARIHLFALAGEANHRVLQHREAGLTSLLFGESQQVLAWPGVDLESVIHPPDVSPTARELVVVATGNDGLGYFARRLLSDRGDVAPPITSQHFPEPESVGPWPDPTLFFRITDDLAGVDASALQLTVNDIAVEPVLRGVPRNYLVTYPLPPDLESPVRVRIEARDRASPSHPMTPFEFRFFLRPPVERLFLRGDANGDGHRDISDPVRILLRLFVNPVPFTLACADAGDADDSGRVDIGDALFLLRHLFQGGSAPPEPGSACGADDTPDGLGCATYTACP